MQREILEIAEAVPKNQRKEKIAKYTESPDIGKPFISFLFQK